MKTTTLVIPLPIRFQAFGGIVGSRIQIVQNGTRAAIQIAYLEKGQAARVRFIEEVLDIDGGPVILRNIAAREVGKNLALDLEIVIGPEKQSTGTNS